jgi:ASC-1-like (ASCH) protein
MFVLCLPERPFRAIQKGVKKIEGRSPDSKDNKYEKMKTGDTLIFEHEETGEKLKTKILFVHHYPDVKNMLLSEGVENVLSSEPKTIEHGIESYDSLTDYKERIPKFGIYAIGVKPVTK